MKNDHLSKFSNLSNWKEEAWKKKKNQGFDGIRTRDLRVAGALLYQLSYEATHDHSSLSSTTAVQKWIISYTSHPSNLLIENSFLFILLPVLV